MNPARKQCVHAGLFLTEQEKVRSGWKAYIQRSVGPDGRVDGTQAHSARSGTSQTVKATCPPPLSTRNASRNARSGSGRWHIPKAMTTASNDSCEKGSACASACSKRTCGYMARAIRTCVAEKSIPAASAPRVAGRLRLLRNPHRWQHPEPAFRRLPLQRPTGHRWIAWSDSTSAGDTSRRARGLPKQKARTLQTTVLTEPWTGPFRQAIGMIVADHLAYRCRDDGHRDNAGLPSHNPAMPLQQVGFEQVAS